MSTKQTSNTRRHGGKPFTKGDPRCNRSGRPPKGQAIAEVYRGLLDAEELTLVYKDAQGVEHTSVLKGHPTMRHKMGMILLTKALEGDISAIKELSDRTEGRPIQSVKDVSENAETIINIGGQRLSVNPKTMPHDEASDA